MERTLELGVLAAAAIIPLRILWMPAARRELRSRPGPAALIGGLGLLAVVIVASVALRSPLALRLIALGAAIGTVLVFVRAAPGYGKRRSLPPGSLGLAESLRAIVDRSFYAERFRRHGPVFKMSQFHNPVVCIRSIGAGRDLLVREAANLALPPMAVSALSPKGFLRYMAPGDYAVYAPLLRAAFSEAVFTAGRQMTRGAARQALEALAGATADAAPGGSGRGVDPRPAFEHFLFGILTRLYFGDLVSEDEQAELESWCRAIGSSSTLGGVSRSARAAVSAFESMLRGLGAPAGPGPTVWGNILDRMPDAAADRTTTANLLILLEASRDSIGGLLLWTIQHLATDPEAVSLLRSDPAASNAVVLETLRLAQSEYVYRRCLRPVEVDGYRVPRGWFVRICVAEAHRADPPFDEPSAFRPRRHLGERFPPRQFAPFGLDRHACLGARMSLFVVGELVDVLGRGFDLRSTGGGDPERGNRHWLHWQPSAGLRIAVSRRE